MRWFILMLLIVTQGCVSAHDEERPLTSVSNEVVKEVSALLGAPAGTECEYSARYEVVRTRAFECAEWGPRPGCLDPTIPCPTVCTRGAHRRDGPESRKLLDRTLVACRDATGARVSSSAGELVADAP